MNKVFLIGRLTRDPETRVFGSGSKVTNFSLAVNDKKKNQVTGQWEDNAQFFDVSAFNSQHGGKLADIIETYCTKGSQVCVEGKLVNESWDDKTTGAKRTKTKITAFQVTLLGGKNERKIDEDQQQEPAMAGENRDGQAADEIPFSWLLWLTGAVGMASYFV